MVSQERMNELRREPDYRVLVRLLRNQTTEQINQVSERYERAEREGDHEHQIDG